MSTVCFVRDQVQPEVAGGCLLNITMENGWPQEKELHVNTTGWVTDNSFGTQIHEACGCSMRAYINVT